MRRAYSASSNDRDAAAASARREDQAFSSRLGGTRTLCQSDRQGRPQREQEGGGLIQAARRTTSRQSKQTQLCRCICAPYAFAAAGILSRTSYAIPVAFKALITQNVGSSSYHLWPARALEGWAWWLLCQPSP